MTAKAISRAIDTADELRRLDTCNIYPRLPFAFDSTPPLSLTMSATHIPTEIHRLSGDELTLHHYAAIVENYLKVNQASPAGNDESLKVPLQNALISNLVFLYFCEPSSKKAHIC
jgi:hypothetical protein